MALTRQNTGWTDLAATSGFTPHSDVNNAAHHAEDAFATVADTPSDLPATGNWRGRRIPVVSADANYEWNGTSWDLAPVFSLVFDEVVGSISGAPTGPTNIRVKMIDQVVTLASNGTANVTYGTTFPNGTIAVLAHNGDAAGAPNTTCEADSAHWTASGFQVYAFATSTGTARTGSFRVVGVAMGW